MSKDGGKSRKHARDIARARNNDKQKLKVFLLEKLSLSLAIFYFLLPFFSGMER